MSRHEITKRNAIVAENYVVVAQLPFMTVYMCKRCGEHLEIAADSPEEMDPNYGHLCSPRPLNPALGQDFD